MEQVVEAMDRGDEMVTRNLAVAAEHIENEARDPASVMDLYTDDIVLEVPGRGLYLDSKSAIEANYRRMFASLAEVDGRQVLVVAVKDLGPNEDQEGVVVKVARAEGGPDEEQIAGRTLDDVIEDIEQVSQAVVALHTPSRKARHPSDRGDQEVAMLIEIRF